MPLAADQVQRIAGLELNALRVAEVIGPELDRVKVPARGTPIHDLNGPVLFHRLPLRRGKAKVGYVDIAVNEAMGEPLLAVGRGAPWDERALRREGDAVAHERLKGARFDTVRFVAYSFPKIALQYLAAGTELLMLELYTWAEVPKEQDPDRKPLEPGHFERWSLLDEMPGEMQRARAREFERRLGLWDVPVTREFDPSVVYREQLIDLGITVKLNDSREVHYSMLDTDHVPCYELRGQQTSVWCVAASAEMLLNFYRYGYTQVRLAQALGLGTLANPNGLPYANVGTVVTALESLTSNALDLTMHTNPGWNVFRDEIRNNRPLISFVPGHSRTVAGYTRSLIALVNDIPFRGLLVYDPWPPNAGVITRWENFATQTYQFAYSSVLQHI